MKNGCGGIEIDRLDDIFNYFSNHDNYTASQKVLDSE